MADEEERPGRPPAETPVPPEPAAEKPPAPEPATPPKRSVGAMLAAVLVTTAFVLTGRFLPLPFTDQTMLQEQLGGGFLGLFNQAAPPVPILALGVTWLFFIRLFTAVIVEGMGRGSRQRVQAIGFAVYMIVSAASALSLCIYLESVESSYYGPPAVLEPGWGFRLLGMLALLAGAALVWGLASWITRTGAAHGTLFLLLLWEVPATAHELFTGGGAVGYGEVGPLAGVVWLVPSIAAGVALALPFFRAPPSWPVPMVGKLSFHSPLDLVAVPFAATHFALPDVLTEVAARTMPALQPLVGGLVALAAAAVLALWWWRRVPPGARRKPLHLAAGFALPLVATGLLAAGFLHTGGLALYEPGPYDGEGTFDVTLTSTDGDADAAADAEALVQRLDELGVEATVLDTHRGAIALRLHEVRDAGEPLGAVLPRREVELLIVTPGMPPETEQEPPAGILRAPAVETEPAHFSSEDRDALERFAASITPAPGHRLGIECSEWDGPGCALRVLDEPPVITGRDIAGASIQFDQYDGQPHVMVDLTEHGGRAFGNATGAHVRDRIAIVVDSVISSSPIVNERIDGGRFQITLGAGPRQAQLEEANAVVAALQPGAALRGRWELASVDGAR